MKSLVPLGLVAVCATVLGLSPGRSESAATAESADARLKAIYTAEWKWREQQFPDNEDTRRPIQDHLPKTDPTTQAMRLRMWQDVLRKLDAIPKAELSSAEQLNYAVYRPQIEMLIAGQQFRDYEMPANADTTFWTDLGYTARRPFRTAQDYRNWIAQMKDVPRYFREQTEEMRHGLKRGFTPPQVTHERTRRLDHRGHRGLARSEPLLYAVQGHAGCSASGAGQSSANRPSVPSATPCSRRIENY